MLDLSRYDRVFILTDEQVASCCLLAFGKWGGNQPCMADAPTLVLPAGEEHKTLQSVQRIWDFLLEHHATRSSLLINLGGGVICDLGGFAAATYMRGIAFVNVPTTLLAMVDAASGGKTGFDYGTPLIKNSIGLFAQPAATIYEPAFLATLPPEQLLSGYAEMIKHAALQSPEALGELLEYDLRKVATPAFGELIKQSVGFKQAIVEQDPHDHGQRQILNFGHTVGHAIEALLLERSQMSDVRNQMSSKPHGYCVMYGIMAEAYMSHVLCGLPAEVVSTLSRFMLENYGAAPVTCNDYEALLALMQHDKKNKEQGTIVCTLLRSVGQPLIGQTVTPQLLREALEYLCNL
ncbi:MAG: 3-dehydroquinate synthase [Paludibacteraceae bacterium]|nr:3-dehydroquinate synthase [Paludibacteraceae bacterium]